MSIKFILNLLKPRKREESIKVPGGYVNKPKGHGSHPRKCTCRKCISKRSKKVK